MAKTAKPAKTKPAHSTSDALLERLRTLCYGFPGTEDKVSHGAPAFFVRGRMFVAFADEHHASGRVAAWCRATHEDQQRLVAQDPERYYVPPYVGVNGWIGVRLDHPRTDWIELAIIVEDAWAAVVPKKVAEGPARPPPKNLPARKVTDPKIARAALERLTAICETLGESTRELESPHATFRVRGRPYAYFLDNHHGDGNIGVCVRVAKPMNTALAKKHPERFYLPAYIAARGWVALRLTGRVDWKDVTARLKASWRAVAPARIASKTR